MRALSHRARVILAAHPTPDCPVSKLTTLYRKVPKHVGVAAGEPQQSPQNCRGTQARTEQPASAGLPVPGPSGDVGCVLTGAGPHAQGQETAVAIERQNGLRGDTGPCLARNAHMGIFPPCRV